MVGFKKFTDFKEASDPQVSSQNIENELNGHDLFDEIVRVPIFWTWLVWRKRKIPNF